MAKQDINYGTIANDGTGDVLRDAFIKTDVLSDAVKNGDTRIEIFSDNSCTLDVNGWNLKVNKRLVS